MASARTGAAKARILVVDDEDFIRRVTEKMLVFLGYEAIAVQSGEEALRIYQSRLAGPEAIDAVILDWMFPRGLNGAETLAGLLGLDPGVKVILSSGLGPAMGADHGPPAGFVGLINKPYDVRTLEATLAAILNPV